MNRPSKLSVEARVAVAALCALGMFAGSYMVAGGGFSHALKRSDHTVFVGGPQAYVVAGIFFAVSVLAALALLRSAGARCSHIALACVVYLAATVALVVALQ